MDSGQKEAILKREQTLLKKKQKEILQLLKEYNDKIIEIKKTAPSLQEFLDKPGDPASEQKEVLLAKLRLYIDNSEELKKLEDSTYFSKCVFDSIENKGRELLIGKFGNRKLGIVSWTSPISRLRFEDISQNAHYEVPSGEIKTVNLLKKFSYIITNSDISYLTLEQEKDTKELIYHKHMSERKQFALPEIVAQLEKAQDEIIRSDPKGGFLISGPAGSGKTTLALHRIAYLTQSPEHEDYYKPEEIVVFVSDDNAVKYFKNLLIDLGIKTAKITTFLEWGIRVINQNLKHRYKKLSKKDAISILINEVEISKSYKAQDILNEVKRIKLRALEKLDNQSTTVEELFKRYKSANDSKKYILEIDSFLDNQLEDSWLDELDMSILIKNGEFFMKTFNHIVVDEAQNWLPIQLEIIQKISDEKQNSVTYVGDVNQKTRTYSLSGWEELKKKYGITQEVSLTKVYRNTKQVLEFLKSKNYDVAPELVDKEGGVVEEIKVNDSHEQHEVLSKKLNELIDSNFKGQIGILTKYYEDLEFSKEENWPDNFHFLTIEDSQGMEFDKVFILNTDNFTKAISKTKDQLNEEESVDRHLFFVGVTRTQGDLVFFIY